MEHHLSSKSNEKVGTPVNTNVASLEPKNVNKNETTTTTTVVAPVNKNQQQVAVVGIERDLELSSVSNTFVKWSGMDVESVNTKNGLKLEIRIPWTTKRLRGTSVFSCTCQNFKQKCTKGTFVNGEGPNQLGKIVFSQSDDFDQLDGGYDFSKHNQNVATGHQYCNHVARVIAHMCSEHDAALDQCGIIAQK